MVVMGYRNHLWLHCIHRVHPVCPLVLLFVVHHMC